MWGVGNGPCLATYEILHHTVDDSICVMHVGLFWGGCAGIYVVMLRYNLVWRDQLLVSCSPIKMLCRNILLLTIIMKFNNKILLYLTGVCHVVNPRTSLKSCQPLKRTLCASTYASTILVCALYDSTYVILGAVWWSVLQWYPPGAGHTLPALSHNKHIHYVPCLPGCIFLWFDLGRV